MGDNYSDNAFHYSQSTTQFEPDYENMAHEAALTYFKTHQNHEILPSEYTKVYLSIYNEILAGLTEEE